MQNLTEVASLSHWLVLPRQKKSKLIWVRLKIELFPKQLTTFTFSLDNFHRFDPLRCCATVLELVEFVHGVNAEYFDSSTDGDTQYSLTSNYSCEDTCACRVFVFFTTPGWNCGSFTIYIGKKIVSSKQTRTRIWAPKHGLWSLQVSTWCDESHQALLAVGSQF